ncbi:MAG: hypothetical protein RMJ88_06300 [Thermogemmata sp.]|nr:hypothetical protein [Thermogemmata sp.]
MLKRLFQRPFASLQQQVIGRVDRLHFGWCWLGLFTWCLFFNLYGITAGPLYRTEGLRAMVARCGWQEGQWLYPVLFGEPFLTKPPGHYLAIQLCSLPWGEVTPVSARLPSVLASFSTSIALLLLLKGVIRPAMAAMAAAVLPLSLLWLDKVPSAEIDMTLTGWLSLALVAWSRAMPRPVWAGSNDTTRGQRWHRGWLCGAAGSLTAATLSKWTAPAFFLVTIGCFAWLDRQWHSWRRWEPWTALAVAASGCLLWAAAVAQSVGLPLLLDTLQQEAAYRLLSHTAAKGGLWSAWLGFPLSVLAALLPLSLPALLLLVPHYRQRLEPPVQRLALFLHCWAWPNLLFWTVVPNHNVRYVLPIAPAVAGLGVLGGYLIMADGQRRWPRYRRRFYWGIAAMFVLGVAVKVVWVEVVIPARTARRNPVPVAAQLRTLIPEHETLYIDKLKDEGVMFYYGRAVRRWRGQSPLPVGAYLALTATEWQHCQHQGYAPVAFLQDQQGDPLIVVRVAEQCQIGRR